MLERHQMTGMDDFLNAFVSWKAYGDTASFMIVMASLLSWLPSIASILSIIWVALRIYETDTIQHLIYHIKVEDDDEAN